MVRILEKENEHIHQNKNFVKYYPNSETLTGDLAFPLLFSDSNKFQAHLIQLVKINIFVHLNSEKSPLNLHH